LLEIELELIRFGRQIEGVRGDTIFAFGLAAGHVSSARSLVGREIDDRGGKLG